MARRPRPLLLILSLLVLAGCAAAQQEAPSNRRRAAAKRLLLGEEAGVELNAIDVPQARQLLDRKVRPDHGALSGQ